MHETTWQLLCQDLFFCTVENEVDGEGFLLLEDSDISAMVKAIGTRRKLIDRSNRLNELSILQFGYFRCTCRGNTQQLVSGI